MLIVDKSCHIVRRFTANSAPIKFCTSQFRSCFQVRNWPNEMCGTGQKSDTNE